MFFKTINGPIIRQYGLIITVNLTLLSTGLGLAWPSPMLVKLRDSTETMLQEPITDVEGSWIVSSGFLAGGLMNFIPPLVLDRLGRKYSIFIGFLPKVVGSVFFLFATKVWMLIFGRVLSNITDTFMFTMVPLYASEIASKEVRGGLNTILQIMCSLGIVIMLSVGPFVSYTNGNILHVTVAIVALVPIMFLPESPYFMYLKGRTKDSLKVLTMLRGSEAAAQEQIKEYASNEDVKINKIELFKRIIFWKSLGLVVMLVIGTQLIGFNAVSFYLQTILESTQSSVRPEIASVIIGLIQLSASLFTTVVTDRFGRKPILCTTLVGMMLGMIGLGAFFFVTDGVDVIVGVMNFLPLVSIILVVFCYSAGVGSLYWAVSAELFDNCGRAVGLSISMIIGGVSIFVLTKFFPTLMTSVGPTATYWGFSVNCFLLCLFILFLVPETKGKTFAEIQKALGSKVTETDDDKPEKC